MSPQALDGVVNIPLAGSCSGGQPSLRPGSGKAEVVAGFVSGPENRLVEAAVASLLLGRRAHYAPVVFHGPSGVGKSHLALGLVVAWKASCPRQPFVYTTAVDFARELADAVETKTSDEFGTRYRQAALLVIEDIDHLAEKSVAQEELIYTLDAVRDAGHQAVLTARKTPSRQTALVPRLRSRLAAGLTVPVAAPGLAARRVVVNRMAGAMGLDLPETVAGALAERVAATVPVLRGVLTKLKLQAELHARAVDLAMLEEQLAERARRQTPTIEQIARATSRHFSLKLSELQSASRARAVVVARDVAMYLARSLTQQSLEKIGRYFGGRDHTTVSHGCRKMETTLKTDSVLRAVVCELRERLCH